MSDGDVVARLGERHVTLAELARRPQWRARLRELFREAADRVLVARAAQEAGIQISNQDLQRAVDELRRQHGLLSANETRLWLEKNRLSLDDVIEEATQNLQWERFQDRLAQQQGEKFFREHQREFDEVIVGRILVADEGLARELVLRLEEGEQSFEELARAYSQDQATAASGGGLGRRRRQHFQAQAESHLFGGRVGQIAGPFEVTRGWEIYHLLQLCPARLDEETSREIRGCLFQQWLNQARLDFQLELWPFVDPASV